MLKHACNGEEPFCFIIAPATVDTALAKKYLDIWSNDIKKNRANIKT